MTTEEIKIDQALMQAYMEMHEALSPKQKALDADGDGDIEADDLADLRKAKKVKEALSPKQKALDADGDGDIEADDLADLRSGKKGKNLQSLKDKYGDTKKPVKEDLEELEEVKWIDSKSTSEFYEKAIKLNKKEYMQLASVTRTPRVKEQLADLLKKREQYNEKLKLQKEDLEEGKNDTSKYSDEKLKAVAKQLSSLDQDAPSTKFMLKKISKEMKTRGFTTEEVEELEEGTWQLPDTPKLMADLKKLMSKPIKLGLDGHKAIDDLQAVVGDDELFDALYVAGKKNPMGDARGVVKKHMKRLGIKEELEEASKLHPDLVAIDKEIDAFHAKTKQHKYLRVAGSARKDADILAKLVKKRDDIYNNIKEEVELEEATNWKKGDGRPKGGSSIENVKFWDLPDASLKYIQKDASDAVKANPEGKKSGKYADEVNDAGTVLFWRKKNKIVVEEVVMEAMTNLHPAVGKAFLQALTNRIFMLKKEVTGNTNNIIGSLDSVINLCNTYKSKL